MIHPIRTRCSEHHRNLFNSCATSPHENTKKLSNSDHGENKCDNSKIAQETPPEF